VVIFHKRVLTNYLNHAYIIKKEMPGMLQNYTVNVQIINLMCDKLEYNDYGQKRQKSASIK
jgi:hypothetical protein